MQRRKKIQIKKTEGKINKYRVAKKERKIKEWWQGGGRCSKLERIMKESKEKGEKVERAKKKKVSSSWSKKHRKVGKNRKINGNLERGRRQDK